MYRIFKRSRVYVKALKSSGHAKQEENTKALEVARIEQLLPAHVHLGNTRVSPMFRSVILSMIDIGL